ncbi:SOS response-associated peptidase [Gaetbulibacter aestuarii]|uniref:Abasic site processing protein n=1 Tax=Gaetbulibacter aestuarii TaxID=1502358 RepID=A0ABW7MZC1_9FLAO
MCFHISTTRNSRALEKRYQVKLSDESIRTIVDKPHYHLNGFAHPNVLLIPQQKPEVLAPGVWGIVPENKQPDDIKPYYKEAVKFGGGLNAQSEKVFNHFLYRNSIRTKRCVIPVNGFFEPHDHQKKKYPFFIKDKSDQGLSLAGIYTLIGTYVTFSILTKKASPLFEKIHNVKKRQPVILTDVQVHNWLSDEQDESVIASVLATPYPDKSLDYYPVSKDLFSTKVDSDVPDILDKVKYEALEEIF